MALPIVLLLLGCVRFVSSGNYQGDLAVTNYSHIGCLTLKANKQFLIEPTERNLSPPYQTFASPQMSIELCFRLCRRWIVLMFDSRTRCICLYTFNQPHELNAYLGQFSATNACSSFDLDVYALGSTINVLPPMTPPSNYDWSLDGCYHVSTIRAVRVNRWLTPLDFFQAIDACRLHCQKDGDTTYYSIFLSRQKLCYCLPNNFSSSAVPVALRQPLIHCSFLPYLCHSTPKQCEAYRFSVNPDTVIKIDIQRYCPPTKSVAFRFDRSLHMCLAKVRLQSPLGYPTMSNNQSCHPLSIRSTKQWHEFLQLPWLINGSIYVWIDQNSTLLINASGPSNTDLWSSNHSCVGISRNDSDGTISVEFTPCARIRTPSDVLCAQQPLATRISYEEGFRMTYVYMSTYLGGHRRIQSDKITCVV